MVEVEKVLSFYERFGPACMSNECLSESLQRYRELIRLAESMMSRYGVAEECTACAKRTGSCCFREMGESYTSVQLLINMLLGSVLPTKILAGENCRFVGERGCTLQGKHSFCLNYFCPDLRITVGKRAIGEIQEVVGKQLLAGWELERALGKWLADRQS